MDVELYFYIEDLALTVAQRNTLVGQLKTIGLRDEDPKPRNRNHWRVRADNKAVIFEGWFDDSQLTAVNLRARLAAIFGVATSSITYATTQSAYGPYMTYTYNAAARARVGVFGGPFATYPESQAAALAYLDANRAAWDIL